MKLIRYTQPDTLYSPIDRLALLRDEFNRLFEPGFSPFLREGAGFNEWTPALDVYEEKDDIVVHAELPGLKKEDIEISLHSGLLSISGERKVERTDNGESRRSERYYGRFSRTVTLPSPVDSDKVQASYKDGVLVVRLPKTEEAKPRQINVSTD